MPSSTPSSATTTTVSAEPAGPRESSMDLLNRYSKPLGVLGLAVVDGVVIWRFGVAPGVLLLCAASMLLVVSLLFRAVQALTGELDEEDELELTRAPTSAEEQKRAAIQALKDIEHERTVGKITKEDYEALVTRYRAEAKRLMRTVDEERSGLRGEAEKLADEAVRVALDGGAQDEAAQDDDDEAVEAKPAQQPAKKAAAKVAKKSAKAAPAKLEEAAEEVAEGAKDDAPIKASAEAADAIPARVACPACQTKNDVDAAFCKKCGAKLEAEVAAAKTNEKDEQAEKAASKEDA